MQHDRVACSALKLLLQCVSTTAGLAGLADRALGMAGKILPAWWGDTEGIRAIWGPHTPLLQYLPTESLTV